MRTSWALGPTALCLLKFALIPSVLSAALPESFTTPEGLQIEEVLPRECTRKSQVGDTIQVHYNGTLEDGTSFDSSYSRNEPFAFRLGDGRVIKGWDIGLLNMCIREERILTIPPELAYGYRRVGRIPAGSTLIFGTKLMAIEGVSDEADEQDPLRPPIPSITSVPVVPSPTSTAPTSPTSSTDTVPAPTSPPEEQDPGNSPGADNGDCQLLGPFALVVQGALGLLALSSLVIKRWRERPRRPVKVWFFDASKQIVGSVLLHIVNLLMSMVSSANIDIVNTAKEMAVQVQDSQGNMPNPCSFYLMNLAIDTTIGIPILVIFLKLLHHGFMLTPLANPPESIRSGNYGHPPKAWWWFKQSMIYFLGLLLMKLCIFFLFQLLPWIAWVGDWALKWTEGSEALQITFVMFIFPLIMNALQYYIVDSIIKDPSGGEGGEPVATSDGSSDGTRALLEEEDDEYAPRDGEADEDAKIPTDLASKELKSSLPQSVDRNGASGSGSSQRTSRRSSVGKKTD